jgi:hypothetical protein
MERLMPAQIRVFKKKKGGAPRDKQAPPLLKMVVSQLSADALAC